mgnify:CR=1 FL=1
MKIFIPASNKYLHLLKGYSILFNKYWKNQQVVVLCYDKPKDELPNNFEIVSLGEERGKYWTNGMIPFFTSLEDEYFVFTIEDHFLIKSVDVAKVEKLEEMVKKGIADKAMLHSHLNAKHGEDYGNGFIKLRQDGEYRTTIHPAIWRRDYLLRYLKPNYTIWDFEVKNMPESKRDGATILALKMPNPNTNLIFDCANIYRNDEVQDHEIARASLKDRKIIMDAINNA